MEAEIGKAVVSLLVLLLVVSTGAVASSNSNSDLGLESNPGLDLAERKIKDIHVLEPTRGSEVILGEVKILTLSDNSTVVSGYDTRKLNQPPIFYNVKIDRRNGTYTTRLKPMPSVLRNKFRGTMGAQNNSQRPESSVAVDPWASVYMYTRDFFGEGFACARTYNDIRWVINSDDTVTVTDSYSYFYAYDPTEYNTSWYVDQSESETTGPWYQSGQTEVYQRTEGHYFNTDFVLLPYPHVDENDTMKTSSWHDVVLQGNNDGTYTYYWNYGDSGEGNSLLSYDISAS